MLTIEIDFHSFMSRFQYKRDDAAESNASYTNSTPREHHHHRYQRRLSLESARTLSDSSSDGEGKF